jgi:apolipoprotein N-acyltransferase
LQRTRFATAAAVFLTNAVLVWFGNGLNPWWPLMWFAPLPLFWLALRSSGWVAALVAFTAWLAGSVSLLNYFLSLETPFSGWLADFGGLSLLVAVGVLIFRALVLRGAIWTGMMAPAAVWVTSDWARYGWTPHGTSADLAYTQLQFLPFLQLASITGPWGMTFLLQLVPAAAAVVLHLRQSDPQRAFRVTATVGGVLLLVLGYGTVRLYEPTPRQTVKVGLIASDTPENDFIVNPGADAQRLLTAYATQASQLAARGAQVIVLPEKIALVRDSDIPLVNSLFQSIADSDGVTIVVGEQHVSPAAQGPAQYNRARVYRPRAAPITYDKEHMLPPFESNLTRGTGKVAFNLNGTRLGIAICKDMDFTSMGLAYADLGAQLMLVPAWDFNSDRNWHGHMAIMRGVESGFSIARAAKNGYLTVSDDRGRIVAEARSDASPFATLLTGVPVEHSYTLFQKWGNSFAWLATAVLAWILVRLVSVTLYPGRDRLSTPSTQ